MRTALLFGAAVLAALAISVSEGFAVVGYVPEYRMDAINWEQAVAFTTHLVLFSLEPKADGELDGVDRLKAVLRPGSTLRNALSKVKTPAKILVTIGGAGRSGHFPKLAGNKKARKKLARDTARLFRDLPMLAGLDLDWEAPTTMTQWRDFGRLAQELRTTWDESQGGTDEETMADRLLTMTYHPGSGAVATFSGLKAKKSETAFVDLFDFCHAMAYSHFDHERRHSTAAIDKSAVEEWIKYQLPLRRLTLGVPLFGVSRKTGATISFEDILASEPTLEQRPEVDESRDGVYFVNAGSLARKVQYAGQQGLGGIMIWELGQDRRSGGMLRHARNAADGVRRSWSYQLSWLPFGENHVIMVLSALVGLHFFKEVLLGTPPGHKLASQRPPPREDRQPQPSPPTDGDAPATAPVPAEPPPAEGNSEGEGGG